MHQAVAARTAVLTLSDCQHLREVWHRISPRSVTRLTVLELHIIMPAYYSFVMDEVDRKIK